MIFRNGIAAIFRNISSMLLSDHPTGCIRNLINFFFINCRTMSLGDIFCMLLSNHSASCVALRNHFSIWDGLATWDLDGRADRLANIVCFADLAILGSWHPDFPADGFAWALHLLLHDWAGTIVRGTGAGVEAAGTGKPDAPCDDLPGNMFDDGFVVAGTNRNSFLDSDRFANIMDSLLGGVFSHRPIFGTSNIASVLFVHRVVSAVRDRHLIILNHGARDGGAVFANMVFIDWVICAICIRDLIRFCDLTVGAVLFLSIVSFIDRASRAIRDSHLIFLDHRTVHCICCFTYMLLIDRVIGTVGYCHCI
jgi:hypothetical protein